MENSFVRTKSGNYFAKIRVFLSTKVRVLSTKVRERPWDYRSEKVSSEQKPFRLCIPMGLKNLILALRFLCATLFVQNGTFIVRIRRCSSCLGVKVLKRHPPTGTPSIPPIFIGIEWYTIDGKKKEGQIILYLCYTYPFTSAALGVWKGWERLTTSSSKKRMLIDCQRGCACS